MLEEAVLNCLAGEELPSVSRHTWLDDFFWTVGAQTIGNLNPRGSNVADIQQTFPAHGCTAQMGAFRTARQLSNNQPCHSWVPLLDHWQAVGPTCPMCGWAGANRTPQAKPPKQSGNRAKSSVSGSPSMQRASTVGMHHPQHVIGPRGCAEGQNQPCHLKVADNLDPLQQHTMRRCQHGQLVLDEDWVS